MHEDRVSQRCIKIILIVVTLAKHTPAGKQPPPYFIFGAVWQGIVYKKGKEKFVLVGNDRVGEKKIGHRLHPP